MDGLIHPVPDGTAHEEVGALYGVPVVHQSAHGVTHGVGILGDVEGIDHVVFSLHGFLYPGDGGILVGTHVDDVVVALVLHGAGGVVSLDGFVSLHEVVAGSGLVAQTPDGHRGVVHRGVYHLHVAGDVGVLELGHVGKTGIAIIVFVALNVGLIFEIDAVFVAEIVPVGCIGIMAVAHVVDVALLHEEHFVLHLLAGYVVSRGGIVFVAVHALHLDGLAIEVVVAACQSELVLISGRVADFYFAEADIGGEGLNGVALLVLQFAHQGITVGSFSTPGFHFITGRKHYVRFHLTTLADFTDRCHGGYAGHEGVLVRIEFVFVERINNAVAFGRLCGEVAYLSRDVERSLGEGVVVVGDGFDVAHLHLGFGSKGNAAEDTRQAEHVLSFEEGAIAVTVNFHCHEVFSFFIQIRSNIKLCQVAGVFRKTDIASVDIEIEKGVHAIEVDVHFLSFPVGGNAEGAAVGAYFVAVFVGEPVLGRGAHHAAFPVADGHLMLEDDFLVHIDGTAILELAILLHTGQVPVHRYFHLVPRRSVEVGAVEVLGTLVGVGSPVKLPLSVERLPQRAVFGQHLTGFVYAFKREEPCVWLLLVVGQRVGTLPFPPGRFGHLSIVKASEGLDLGK